MTDIEKEAFINLVFLVKEFMDTVDLPYEKRLRFNRIISLIINKVENGMVE